MGTSLQFRKQELVRTAIHDAAIELFAKKGFDETTVEEVAQEAGVSRRTFFRYYATKDDLLAENVVKAGEVLVAAIESCPAALAPIDVVREAVHSGLRFSASDPRTRKVIEISMRSRSARQAHHSRMLDVEDAIAEAFAKRLKQGSKHSLKPRMLAGLTLLASNLSVISWFSGAGSDSTAASKPVFASFVRMFCENGASAESPEATVGGRRQPRVK